VNPTIPEPSSGAVTAEYFVFDSDQMVLELVRDGDVTHRLF
jgi:hypothetical protein